ncbi:outer membrane beta-barrel protein [Niabella yanshanensis]|uniref:Outer membrane beta-barrel protein n=1 Tax=Niabella yanshanensis TaxID=577386 RepID=A0ABZ0W1X9_9BACT|nr:outer membrane beta-barrel family protein [Niabella yanshanensis]WQD36643.1 outer membrane beta-barrel protein [Niabella yanshanensis]
MAKNLTIHSAPLLILLTCFSTAFAQDGQPVTVKGKVVDSLQQPVAWATIKLMKKDSVIATSAANEQGVFQLTAKKAITDVQITSTAYAPFTKAINMDKEPGAVMDLGTLTLSKNSGELKGVTVTASRPLITREIDKLVYSTEADPESKFSSVLEIMRKVPFLAVDGQENLTMKGSSSYRILINGKPSGMVDNDPKSFLRSLPASSIQSIEVYTTPPAKYDAEGLGGVINIVTTKRVGEGYKGNINLNGAYPNGGPGAGLSFTATHKKLGVELFGGSNLYYTPSFEGTTYRATTGTNPSTLNVTENTKRNGHGRYVGTQFSYDIDSLQLLTAQLNFNGSDNKSNYGRFSQLLSDDGTQRFSQLTHSKGSGNGFDGGLNYQLGFKKDKARLLTVSYRYMQYKSGSDVENMFYDTLNYTEPDFNQKNNTDFIEQTGQVDYVQNIKKVKMEAGIKAIFRENNSHFNTFELDPVLQQDVADGDRQNEFENKQSILSAYNTYSFALKSWGFKFGARLEQTYTDVDFSSTQTKIKNNYFNLVPSIVINKNNKNGSYFNIGYNQRLKRPGINRLNPFVDRSDPNFIESGNPNLQPSLMHSFDLGYGINKKQSVNIGLMYAFADNLDLKTSRYDSISQITYTTFENSGKIDALMLNANFNLAITKQLRTVINGSISHFWIESAVDVRDIKTKRTLYNAAVSNTYTFQKDWLATVSVNLYSNNLAPAQIQGMVNGYVATNFSVSKNLLNKKLSLSAYVNNPFTQYRNNRTEVTSYNFIEINTNRDYFRRFGMSVNYKFGKLKDDVKKSRRGINNNDVSN